ncbi:MAG: hypothetical protein AAFX65_11035 [Cyanobacteria bacterium J06638_7]
MPAASSRFRLLPLALGAAAFSVLCPGPARAHGIQSNLEMMSPLSEQVRREFVLQSEFSTGEPAGDAAVRLWRPGGETIEMGRTDGQGRLRFELPAELSAGWEVQVDAGPGHRDYLELSEASAGGVPQQADGRAPEAPAGRLLASRPTGASLPLVGGLALGLSAAGGILFGRRRR